MEGQPSKGKGTMTAPDCNGSSDGIISIGLQKNNRKETEHEEQFARTWITRKIWLSGIKSMER